ncbi:MAG: hypothetical protein EBV57_03335, partial [Betaproteobacteria bacterium]|nr:hypothetical protein [Betaproteobacteria bacterium]
TVLVSYQLYALAAQAGIRVVLNGQGADTDIVVASVKAYLSALNRLHSGPERAHPQVSP